MNCLLIKPVTVTLKNQTMALRQLHHLTSVMRWRWFIGLTRQMLLLQVFDLSAQFVKLALQPINLRLLTGHHLIELIYDAILKSNTGLQFNDIVLHQSSPS